MCVAIHYLMYILKGVKYFSLGCDNVVLSKYTVSLFRF